MATMRSVLDYKEHSTSARSVSTKMAPQAPPTSILVAYGLFFLCAGTVYHFVANQELSAILTMSVMFQCLGFVLVGSQVLSRDSVAGISARSLGLEAVALVMRLSSTLWLEGYLPVDATGDWIYQTVDVVSLMLVLWLLYYVLVEQSHSYQKADDSLSIEMPVIIGSIVIGALFHADLDHKAVFDALWMAGLFVGALAVLPQLWLIQRTGGKIKALTSHYIAAVFVSRLLSGIFWWLAREDIVCTPWIEGWHHGAWAVLGAHLLNLLLLGDFAYYYVRAVTRGGLSCDLSLQADGVAIMV